MLAVVQRWASHAALPNNVGRSAATCAADTGTPVMTLLNAANLMEGQHRAAQDALSALQLRLPHMRASPLAVTTGKKCWSIYRQEQCNCVVVSLVSGDSNGSSFVVATVPLQWGSGTACPFTRSPPTMMQGMRALVTSARHDSALEQERAG